MPTGPTEPRSSPLIGFVTGFGLVVSAAGAADLVWRELGGRSLVYFVPSIGLGILGIGLVVDAGHPTRRWWENLRWGMLVAGAVVAGVSLGFGASSALVAGSLLSGLVGASMATSWRRRPPVVLSGEPSPEMPRSIAVVGVVVVTVWIVMVTVPAGTLGHDESVYAVQGRSWILDVPATSVQVYRSPGVSVIAAATAMFTDSLVPLRVVAAAMSLGFLALVWLVGRRLFSSGVGVVAALAVGGATPFLRRAGEFLADVPSAALMLIVVALIHDAFEHDRRGRLVLAVVPAAIAFYVRYGVALTMVAIIVAAGWTWRTELRRRAKEIGLAAALGAVALAPHFVWASVTRGDPFAAISSASSVAGGTHLGEGFIEYLTQPVVAFGILGVALSLVAGTAFRSGSAERMLLLTGLLSIVAIGARIHAEPRYVYFPLAVLVLVGVRRLQAVAGSERVWFVAVAGCVVVGSVAALQQRQLVVGLAESYEVVAGASIRAADLAGPDCDLLTGSRPQVELYSECPTRSIGSASRDPVDESGEVVVWFENGKNQEDGSVIDDLDLAETIESDTESPGDASLYVAPAVPR